MGRTKVGIWSHFLSLSRDEGGLKAYYNKSHKNAWCKYCIGYAVRNQLGDEDNMAEFDVSLNTTSNYSRRQHRCMKDAKPVRGVSDMMAKHLRDCEHQPDSVNLSTIPADAGTVSGTSQLQSSQPRQSILQLQTRPQSFSTKTRKEFHTDFLRMWIAIGASYWSADQTEVRLFFEK